MLLRLNKQIGIWAVTLFLTLSIMSSLIVTYHFNIRLPNTSDPDYSYQYYNKPYCRIAPYLVGILFGQLYYDRKLAKRGEFKEHRSCGNLLFQAYQNSSFISWASALIGAFLTTFLIFFYKTSYPQDNWSLSTSMIWNSMSRPLFMLGMMLVLLPTF